MITAAPGNADRAISHIRSDLAADVIQGNGAILISHLDISRKCADSNWRVPRFQVHGRSIRGLDDQVSHPCFLARAIDRHYSAINRERDLPEKPLRFGQTVAGRAQAGFDRIMVAIPALHLNASMLS